MEDRPLDVARMGGKNPDVFDNLKQTLFTDSAIVSKVTGFAMGLILLGTMDVSSMEEMLTYVRETQHKKIIRSLAIGVGFIYYGCQEEVNKTIQLLPADKVYIP